MAFIPDITSETIAPHGQYADQFDNVNETATVEPKILVVSDVEVILSNFDGDVLNNHGVIYGLSIFQPAVRFKASLGTIVNSADGSIISSVWAVSVDGDATVVDNAGSMIGFNYGLLFNDASKSSSLNNSGDIFSGGFAAVGSASNDGTSTINNSGTLRSPVGDGILVDSLTHQTTIINNSAAGTISGGHFAIEVMQGGAFSLTNDGKVLGGIAGGGDIDVVVNRGLISGSISLGGGDDLYNGRGGEAARVFGGDGSDRIIGSRFADQIHGGDRNDMLTGGPGKDQFFFDTALNPATNVDQITDFTPGVDKMMLQSAEFRATGPLGKLAASHFLILGTRHETHSDRIIYNPANGLLSFDQDGSGHTYAPVHFAAIGHHLNPHNMDFILSP
jgi:Ca2+-binding RTX toxin-like protein